MSGTVLAKCLEENGIELATIDQLPLTKRRKSE
jgi:hypothetical protein